MEKKILELLKENISGLRADEISEKLDINITIINSLLYKELKHECVQDNKYRWFLNENYSIQNKNTKTTKRTRLANLAQYYLSCLSNSEVEISTYAKSKYDDEDYIELSQLSNLALDSDVKDFYLEIQRDMGNQKVYLGYPTSLKKVKSTKSNWGGFFVEPIFLIPIDLEDGFLNIQYSSLTINFVPLKKYTNANQERLMDELFQLEEELGLTNNGDVVELEEISRRLKNIRPGWLWQEDINPENIAYNNSLKDLYEEGIYNRGICICHEGSRFTQGLESELQYLSQLEETQYEQSILGKWINGYEGNSEQKEIPLLEVLPMNLEQTQAVNSALNNDLTVITGPPGTGKSQVVTNLLVNAVWHGKKVLFASKNNKAVDVVEIRANNLGPHSFLLRMGSFTYSSKLLEYLINLMSAKVTQDDENEYNFYKQEYNKLLDKLSNLKLEEENIINIRNHLDSLSQDIEVIRKNVCIDTLKIIDIKQLEEKYNLCKTLFGRCIKRNRIFIIRLIWSVLKRKYYKIFLLEVKSLISLTKELPLTNIQLDINEDHIERWEVFFKELNILIDYTNRIHKYFSMLEKLTEAKSLENIARRKFDLINNMSSHANNLWQKWLKLKSKSLSSTERKEISQYRALYEMINDGGNQYNQYNKEIYRKYMEISQKTSHLFSAWAITSLSIKGKVPLKENIFDIVIFDEASQCDIASALPLLYRAKSAIIIGDPKQLSHISSLNFNQDKLLLQKYGLLENFSHWAYSCNSLFQLSCSFANQNNIVKLKDHHRSHKDIINFSNKYFYGEDLRIATNYSKLNPPTLDDIGIRWESIPGRVVIPDVGGAENQIEAQAVVDEIKKLINKNYTGSIGVVTPFRAQANLIRKLINKEDILSTQLIKNEFLVDTVHKFQGDERDVMVFSPVISKGISKGSLNFINKNRNLFNVAITRARALLLVVGDSNFISKSDATYLKEFAKYSQDIKRRKAEEVTHSIQHLTIDYPKVSDPEKVSEWEHIFYKALYRKGIKVIPQYQVDKYILDFALFSESDKKKLNIEVDGERYHRNWTGELCRRDQIRNHRLIELGWDIRRFWVYQIRDQLDECVDTVQDWLNNCR